MLLGFIQDLRNTMGVGAFYSGYLGITKVYGPKLLALPGGAGCQISRTKVLCNT